MQITIKVENNLLEILKYLENLGFRWNTGDTPTKGVTDCIQKYCLGICINDNVIAWNCLNLPGSISLSEFHRRYLNGILLEPGMTIEDDADEIIIVIPHKARNIAFVSYSDRNRWNLTLGSLLSGNIKKIYDIPSGVSICGNILWEAEEITLNDKPSCKEEIIEKISNYSGNIKVILE